MRLRKSVIVVIVVAVVVTVGANIAYGAYCGIPGIDPAPPPTAYWSACF